MTGTTWRQIVAALDEAETIKGRPTAIIAHTVKGKGFSFAESIVAFHNGAMTQAQYDLGLKEADAVMAEFQPALGTEAINIWLPTAITGNAYGETLVELGKADQRIVALDADLCKSTMSVLFQDAFPDRYLRDGDRRGQHDVHGGGAGGERQDRLCQHVSRSSRPAGPTTRFARRFPSAN